MKSTVRRTTLAVDVVVLSPRAEALAVLLMRAPAGARERWTLPWDAPQQNEGLEEAAARIAESVLGSAPAFFEQVGAFSEGKRHPGDADISIAIVALVPARDEPPATDSEWFPLESLPPLAPRHRAVVERAAAVARQRVDQSPLAFRLLPPTFTLSDLQSVYELLLGRRLHKASFRRALQSSYLVEPTDEWRSEGRGRPAQLFRFAPKKRRGARRGVRFDL
ncbi:MAG TPA: NUDIX domain-containing protein, partial [Gemmatimonadaceae bacterium]|nr:NUDIX domain-containing protein [Gemmatimonadaceae bacterium]